MGRVTEKTSLSSFRMTNENMFGVPVGTSPDLEELDPYQTIENSSFRSGEISGSPDTAEKVQHHYYNLKAYNTTKNITKDKHIAEKYVIDSKGDMHHFFVTDPAPPTPYDEISSFLGFPQFCLYVWILFSEFGDKESKTLCFLMASIGFMLLRIFLYATFAPMDQSV